MAQAAIETQVHSQVEECWIDQADHMLHHDQPEECARLIEEFFRDAA